MVEIDAQAHRGAFVIVARKVADAQVASPLPAHFGSDVAQWLARFDEMAAFWQQAGERVRAQEARLPASAPMAIYGAGFYGAFIVSCLRHPERVVCHLDQNVFLQGRELNGRPIVPPQDRPEGVNTVWVGLNPVHARQVIARVPSLAAGDVRVLYLE